MSDIVIRAENLGKLYRVGQLYGYNTLRESLTNAVLAPFRRRSGSVAASQKPKSHNLNSEYIWALKDVSFEIRRGEAWGIIGLNGAGKTTLLKILSRITTPTEGYAEIHGRVGSLLEVGTGFHAELTGRENIYLYGAVLGMKRAEINRKFDEIVEFSEVRKFIDTPLKRYSTGMQVRLAFSVAAHLEPEILLVDEVLAVGDVAFQRKCLGRMEGVVKGGRTVLFVSHNMGMISTLCEKAILLDNGYVEFMGSAQETVSKYLTHLRTGAGLKKEWSFEEAPGGDYVKLKAIRITNRQGIEQPYFSCTEPIYVTMDYWVLHDDVPINMGFWLFDEKENWICGVGNYTETKRKAINKHGPYRSRCTIPGNLLNSGRYTLTVEIIRNRADSEIRIPHCVAFETVDDHRVHSRYSKWGGIIKPDFEWQTESFTDEEFMNFHAS